MSRIQQFRVPVALWGLAMGSMAPAFGQEIGEESGFVWKAARAERTIYVAGALHYLASADYPLPKSYLDAFHASDVLYFEVQPAEWRLNENIRYLEEAGSLSKEQSLWKLLDPEDARQLREALSVLGGSLPAFAAMRPWRAGIELQGLSFMRVGLEGKHGVDAYLAALGQKAGKRTRSLESAREQIQILAGLPSGEEIALLMETVAGVESVGREMLALRKAWKNGDVARMSELCADAYAGNRERERVLLGERNQRWIEYLDRLSTPADAACMVVVGVSHLVVREQNLLDGLRAKGFQITRVGGNTRP